MHRRSIDTFGDLPALGDAFSMDYPAEGMPELPPTPAGYLDDYQGGNYYYEADHNDHGGNVNDNATVVSGAVRARAIHMHLAAPRLDPKN